MNWRHVLVIIIGTSLLTAAAMSKLRAKTLADMIDLFKAYNTIPNTNVPLPVIAMALGLDEEKQMWNRIRVDDRGHVICAKP